MSVEYPRIALEYPPDCPVVELPMRRKRNRKPSRPQILDRKSLDRRTNAAKHFDAIARAIALDLGGEAKLTAIEKHLVEAFAGIAITVGEMNVRKALGQDVDILQQSQAISTMVRIASRLGIHRVVKPGAPTVDGYLEHKTEAAE
jgi:hypothetical protein